MTSRAALALFGCIFAAGSSFTGAAEIVPLNGKPIPGTVIGIAGEFLDYKDAEGKLAKIPVKSLAVVDFGTKPVNPTELYDEIELTDGSVLKVTNKDTLFKVKSVIVTPAAVIKGVAAPSFEIPLNTVYHWVRKANDGSTRTEWKSRVVDKRNKRDLLVLRGETGDFQPLEGTVIEGSADGTKIVFETATGARQETALTRINGGLVFIQTAPAVIPPTACRVFDAFGNNLLATSVTLAEKDGKATATVKTVGGATVEYPALAGISKFDFSQGNVKYLAELDPTVDAPMATEGDLDLPYLKNKTPDGPFRLGGKTYAKGIWIAPESALTYKLDGDYREFKAMLGIDEAVAVATGSVKVLIEADGRKLLEQSFTRKENKPVEVNLNVKDVKSLKISVERDTLFTGASLSLAEAKLQK